MCPSGRGSREPLRRCGPRAHSSAWVGALVLAADVRSGLSLSGGSEQASVG